MNYCDIASAADMSNYPDDVSPASFDRYWADKLDDLADRCDGCGGLSDTHFAGCSVVDSNEGV